MSFVYTLGRIFVPIVFIASGIRKATDVAGTAKMIFDTGLPVPEQIVPYLGGIPKYEALGYLIAAIEIICGLMILFGLKARWGALVLIVFSACTIVFVHHFWDMQGPAFQSNLIEALKYLAIIGALLLIVACGSRGGSLEERSAA